MLWQAVQTPTAAVLPLLQQQAATAGRGSRAAWLQRQAQGALAAAVVLQLQQQTDGETLAVAAQLLLRRRRQQQEVHQGAAVLPPGPMFCLDSSKASSNQAALCRWQARGVLT